MLRLSTIICSLIFPLCIALSQSKQPLNNNDILEMVKAGIQEETIIRMIEASDARFDTSVQGLLALKSAGLSDRLILTMMTASSRPATSKVDSELSEPLPDELGIYLLRQGKLEQLRTEVVTLRNPGREGRESGVVKGRSSGLRLRTPLEFLIRCPENLTAKEYVLLQLRPKSDRREFRTLLGGKWTSDGPAQMSVPFEIRRIAPGTYKVRVEAVTKGEYGFIPPGGAFAQTAASVGRIYAFSVE